MSHAQRGHAGAHTQWINVCKAAANPQRFSQADYTVGDMKLWLKVHKNKNPAEYDLVGPKGRWKMGAGSEVLQDDQVISDFMGERFEHYWLMQLSLFPKKKNEETGKMESTFETVEEWVPPVRPPLRRHCQRPTTHTLHTS